MAATTSALLAATGRRAGRGIGGRVAAAQALEASEARRREYAAAAGEAAPAPLPPPQQPRYYGAAASKLPWGGQPPHPSPPAAVCKVCRMKPGGQNTSQLLASERRFGLQVRHLLRCDLPIAEAVTRAGGYFWGGWGGAGGQTGIRYVFTQDAAAEGLAMAGGDTAAVSKAAQALLKGKLEAAESKRRRMAEFWQRQKEAAEREQRERLRLGGGGGELPSHLHSALLNPFTHGHYSGAFIRSYRLPPGEALLNFVPGHGVIDPKVFPAQHAAAVAAVAAEAAARGGAPEASPPQWWVVQEQQRQQQLQQQQQQQQLYQQQWGAGGAYAAFGGGGIMQQLNAQLQAQQQAQQQGEQEEGSDFYEE